MLSHHVLSLVQADIKKKLLFSKLQRVRWAEDDSIVLVLKNHTSREQLLLLLSYHARYGRIHLIEEKPQETKPFCHYLESHLKGKILCELHGSPKDRIVKVGFRAFQKPEEQPAPPSDWLVLELLGRASNLYVLKEVESSKECTILRSARPIARSRALQVSGFWQAPQESSSHGAPQEAEQGSPFDDLTGKALHQKIEAYYAREKEGQEASKFQQQLEKILRKAVRKASRNLDQAKAEELKNARYHDYRVWADLLQSSLDQVQPGLEKVIIKNYDQAGEPYDVQIPLDPRKSGLENMQAYYRKYQKAKRAVSSLDKRQDLLKQDLEALENFQTKLKAPDLAQPECMKMHQNLDFQRLAKRYTPALLRSLQPEESEKRFDSESLSQKSAFKKAEQFSDLPANLRPRSLKSKDDWEILVGKSDKGNDYLTMRIARGNDWFLHVADYQGSHVILRGQADKQPPQESLLDAAQLAFFYSKAKKRQGVLVNYAQRKHLSKPRRAKPGLVMLSRFKTLKISRDEKRLSRLLGRDQSFP